MSEYIWKHGSELEVRRFVMGQDFRFRAVMRAELEALAEERGRRLVKKTADRDILRIRPTEPSQTPIGDANRIIQEVCDSHGVTKGEMLGRQRSKPIATARQEACWRLSKETTLSLAQIGRKLGGRDHTTVMHGIRRHLENEAANG